MTTTSTTRAVAAFSLGTLFFGYAFLQRVAPSVMTEELMRDFSVGGAALGGLSAWYFYAYAGIQLPVGILTDRFGARRLMTLAALVCALASVGFATSDSVISASFSRALIGASVAFCFVGTLSIASWSFPARRFAMLAGVLQTVGMMGAILGQAPLRLWIEATGWRATGYGLAAVALVLAILCYLVIPRRPSAAKRDRTGKQQSVVRGLAAVLRNPQSWACAIAAFGMTAAMLSFAGLWAVPWLSETRELDKTEAAAITSMLFLGWALASPIAGWVSDHMGRRKPVLLLGITGNLVFLSLIILGKPESGGLLSLLFFLTGISGSAMTVLFSAMRELNPAQYSGTALGLMNMFVVGSGAVMQPVIGWLLDRGWNGVEVEGVRLYAETTWEAALLSLLIVNALGLLGLLLMRETRCKQQD